MTLPGRLAPVPFAGQLSGAIPFIGRTAERQNFAALLSEAGAGEPRLCLIRGEPGTGKSRLALEFLAEADAAGWQTLKGRCLDGAVSPLAPFTAEVLPRMRQASLLPPESRRDPAPPATDGPAFARLFVDLAARRPLVFVIDDLQLLEGGALTFFRDFCMALSDLGRNKQACVIVVATLRLPAESAPVNEALDRLTREPIARVIDITGFGEVETNELVRRATGKNCDPLLLGFLSEATRGNPLFLGEALRELSARGALSEEGGSLHANVDLDHLVLPNSAPAVIRQRLERLPAELIPVLELAALLGEEFSANTLVATGGPADPGVPLDRLASEGVLLGDGEHFRFSHALIRQAAIEGIPPGRRRMLHQQIADGLLAAFGDSTERILEIAEHRAHASTSDDTETAHFFETAGDTAMESFAWNLGARYYARAVGNAAYLAGLGAEERGRTYSKLARAHANCGDQIQSRASAFEAITLLSQTTNYQAWGNALLAWERTFPPLNQRIQNRIPYETFKDAVGDGVPMIRAQLAAQWAEELWLFRDPADEEAAARAVVVANQTDDHEVKALAYSRLGLAHLRHLKPEPCLVAFEDTVRETSTIANPRVRGWGAARVALPLTLMGRLAEAEAAASRSLREAIAGNDYPHRALNLAVLSVLASLRGDSAAMQNRLAEGAMSLHRASYAQADFIFYGTLARYRLLRGEAVEAGDALGAWRSSAGRAIPRSMALLHESELGEPATRAAPAPGDRPGASILSEPDFSSLGSLCLWVEVAALHQDRELAESAYPTLERAVSNGVQFSVVPGTLIHRCLGMAARIAGQELLAEKHLHEALRVAKSAGALTEVALTHLEFARLHALRDPANYEPIVAHASEASEVARKLGMDSVLNTAREILRGVRTLRGVTQPLQVHELELSPIELEVVTQFGQGLSEPQIAFRLLLSESTVAETMARARRRLGLEKPEDARRLLHGPQPLADNRIPPPAPTTSLSRREIEVIRLIALGRTNQQIADELVISLHTVARHVANIFDKTGAANRTEAARFAG